MPVVLMQRAWRDDPKYQDTEFSVYHYPAKYFDCIARDVVGSRAYYFPASPTLDRPLDRRFLHVPYGRAVASRKAPIEQKLANH